MTPEQLRAEVQAAKAAGVERVSLVFAGPCPRGFPRGELLCENRKKERVYSVKVKRLEAWLEEHFPSGG